LGREPYVWTVNARAITNFVSLRAHETVQREIRRYAEAVETFLAAKMPVTYEAFVESDRTALSVEIVCETHSVSVDNERGVATGARRSALRTG